MFCTISYEDAYDKEKFQTKEYSYKTDLCVEVGDVVLAETYRGEVKAIVRRINVPESEIDPKWINSLRSVTKYYEKTLDEMSIEDLF